ncbi:MAG: hypothetical protein KBD21_03880 [Candidatus Pacebacteria bacterium]|nr:hypothetical protein [Candidatus Paceibacterota bacterium]
MFERLNTFLQEFKISEDDFERTQLRWEDLQDIKHDYKTLTKELELIAHYIEDKLQGLSAIHSVRCRVKDPNHLIAKIIRKRIAAPGRKITLDNYRAMITDLIGIRAIHLFKEDWVYIHRFIEDTFTLFETPIAYIRAGDAGQHIEEYKRYEFAIREHPYGYRSIHYLVESKPSKDVYIAEIQVRTIFEEGWSEIDHTIKYPKNVADPLLDTFLDNFNILAGNSDQMGSFVRNLKEDLLKGTQKLEMYEKLTEEHAGIIDTLKKRVAGTIGELNAKVRNVEKKIHTLVESGVDMTEFERVLESTRRTVVQFERQLAREPQKATELFEVSITVLERVEALLEIMLKNHDHANRHREGKISVSGYKQCAVLFSENVQLLTELDPALNVSTYALRPVYDEAHVRVESAVDAVRARNGFTRLLIGPRYTDLQFLRDQVVTNKENLCTLAAYAKNVTDPATNFVFRTQIDFFTEQNGYLQAFVQMEEKGVSVFGWLFKSLARR